MKSKAHTVMTNKSKYATKQLNNTLTIMNVSFFHISRPSCIRCSCLRHPQCTFEVFFVAYVYLKSAVCKQENIKIFFHIYQKPSKQLVCKRGVKHNSTICKYDLESLQFNGGMAGKKRLLRADSDGWGVSGAIGLVLSIRCISLLSCCPLRRISRRSITQWHIGGEEGGTHSAGQR